MTGPPSTHPTCRARRDPNGGGEGPSPMMNAMLRLLTAGESHGKALVGVLEGLPAGVPVSPEGDRGRARQAAARPRAERSAEARGRPVRDRLRRPSRPHAGQPDRGHDRERGMGTEVPGPDGGRGRRGPDGAPHASAARPRGPRGAQKYGFDDVRNVLERASARETAMRVALGVFCKALLAELGIARGLARRADRQGRRALDARPAARGSRRSSTRRPSDASTRWSRIAWWPRSTASVRPATPWAGCSR